MTPEQIGKPLETAEFKSRAERSAAHWNTPMNSPPRPSQSARPRQAINSLLSSRDSIAMHVDELKAQIEDLERRQNGER